MMARRVMALSFRNSNQYPSAPGLMKQGHGCVQGGGLARLSGTYGEFQQESASFRQIVTADKCSDSRMAYFCRRFLSSCRTSIPVPACTARAAHS